MVASTIHQREARRDSRLSRVCPVSGLTFKEEIGSGAFGKVYSANLHDKNGRVDVAVKVIDLKNLGVRLADVQNEATVVKGLAHHNLVRTIDSWQKDGFYFIMQEHVDGRSLDRLLRRTRLVGRLQESFVRECFSQLMQAVQYCHTNGVIHRDIKFENVLLRLLPGRQVHLKLCDFGVAAALPRLQGGGAYNTNAAFTARVGSVYTAAPEVLLLLSRYKGPPVDVWSAGICLFEMVCGVRPWEQATCSNAAFKFSVMAAPQCNGSLVRACLTFHKKKHCAPSEDITHLLDCMLAVCPRRRASVSSVLLSDWMVRSRKVELQTDCASMHPLWQLLPHCITCVSQTF